MAFSITQRPGFFNAVNNPILLSYYKDDYQIGELFFLEIHITDNRDVYRTTTVYGTTTLLQTMRINGDGQGNATFDISDVLNSVFVSQRVTPVNPSSLFQKDESSYLAFYTKAGYITYDAQNQEVKSYKIGTEIQWACRAALPRKGVGDLAAYAYQGVDAVKFMSNITAGTRRKRSEDTLLTLFLSISTTGCSLNTKADLTFRDGSTDTVSLGDFPVNTGGLYVLNAKPQFFQTHPKYQQLKSYSVYASFSEAGVAQQITERREFGVAEDVQSPNKLLFLNRLGGWDVIQFNKDVDTKIKYKGSDFTNTFNTRTYQVQASTSLTYHSGWLTQAEFQWLTDLMGTPYLVINNQYFRKQDADFTTDTTTGLFTIDLTVSPDYEENTIQL